jgi:hypothetical protein
MKIGVKLRPSKTKGEHDPAIPGVVYQSRDSRGERRSREGSDGITRELRCFYTPL